MTGPRAGPGTQIFLHFQATLAKCGSGPEALTVSTTTVLDYLLCAGHIPGMLTNSSWQAPLVPYER